METDKQRCRASLGCYYCVQVLDSAGFQLQVCRSAYARKAGMLLHERHRRALWREERPRGWTKLDTQRAVDELLCFQLLAVRLPRQCQVLFGAELESLLFLYGWVAPASYYVGIAHVHRKTRQNATGIACRWLEHLTLMIRGRYADAGKLQYKLMRRFRPEQTCFFIARAGADVMIRAMEKHEILSRRPNEAQKVGACMLVWQRTSPEISPIVGPFDVSCGWKFLSLGHDVV